MLGFYNAVAEKETSEGRIDCVVECPKYVYILEFKLNGSADDALKQIKDKDYAAPYAADERTVIGIGINFSSEKGTIDGFKSEVFSWQTFKVRNCLDNIAVLVHTRTTAFCNNIKRELKQ